jgi:hypothetical protein
VQVCLKYVNLHVRTLETHVLIYKKMSLYSESQFDSQPLEFVDGQALELCDDYDHK